jgi:hypothetical protein
MPLAYPEAETILALIEEREAMRAAVATHLQVSMQNLIDRPEIAKLTAENEKLRAVAVAAEKLLRVNARYDRVGLSNALDAWKAGT